MKTYRVSVKMSNRYRIGAIVAFEFTFTFADYTKSKSASISSVKLFLLNFFFLKNWKVKRGSIFILVNSFIYLCALSILNQSKYKLTDTQTHIHFKLCHQSSRLVHILSGPENNNKVLFINESLSKWGATKSERWKIDTKYFNYSANVVSMSIVNGKRAVYMLQTDK